MELKPVITELRERGLSLAKIADPLPVFAPGGKRFSTTAA